MLELETRCLLAAVTVNITADLVDGDTSSIEALKLAPGDDDSISLREAVIAANNTTGNDTIQFDPSLDGLPITLSVIGTDEDSAASGDLDINDDATVQGNGPNNTIIDGGQIDRVLDMFAEDVHLTGLTVRNGLVDGPGGGIYQRQGLLNISDSTISGNSATSGGGLEKLGAAYISGSTFSDNDATTGIGGGIYSKSGDLSVSDSTISENTADTGDGGGIATNTSELETTDISNSEISGNSAALGGGLSSFNDGGTTTISRSTISGNTAEFGGGIFAESYAGGNITVSESMLSANTAPDGSGGAIASFNDGGTTTISRSTITGNTAEFGGGIFSDSYAGGNITISESMLSANTAPYGYGGAIASYNDGGTTSVSRSTISGNTAEQGGGIILTTYAGGSATISESAILDNVATYEIGGGIALYNDGGTTSISQSTVSGNTSEVGGGIASLNENGGTTTISNSTVTGNTAGSAGGGIASLNFSQSGLSVSQSTISDNVATDGAGGGIYSGLGDVAVSDSTISGNTAPLGGGIAANLYLAPAPAARLQTTSGDATATATVAPYNFGITNSTISGNTASTAGGGVFNGLEDYSQINILNSTIADNTADGAGGGVQNLGQISALISTIIGDNTSPLAPDLGQTGTIGSATNNLIESPLGHTIVHGTDDNVVGFDPELGPLANNGGPTLTHALLPASRAIDAGANPENLALDQRGFVRTTDGNTDDAAMTDIGAFEFNSMPPPPLVIDAIIRGQFWDPNVVPFSLVTDLESNKPLPWVTLDQIDVVFSQDVQVDIDSLTLAGVNMSSYVPNSLVYDTASFTASWIFAVPLGTDKFLLTVGDDFDVRFDVLQGDSTQDNRTDIGDLVNIATRVPSQVGQTPVDRYQREFDLNGDGRIDVGDLVNAATRVPSQLPPGEPAPAGALDAVFQALAPPLQMDDGDRDPTIDEMEPVATMYDTDALAVVPTGGRVDTGLTNGRGRVRG